MTSDDTRNLLADIDAHAERLDKTHVRQLHRMLMSVFDKERVARDDIHRIMTLLMAHAAKLDKTNIKKLYKIAIRYDLGPKCFACNQPMLHIREFSWDHLYPHSKGGSDDLQNLVPMHKSCNQDKGDNVIEIVISEDYSICFDADALVVTVENDETPQSDTKKKRHVIRFRPWHRYEQMFHKNCKNCKKR